MVKPGPSLTCPTNHPAATGTVPVRYFHHVYHCHPQSLARIANVANLRAGKKHPLFAVSDRRCLELLSPMAPGEIIIPASPRFTMHRMDPCYPESACLSHGDPAQAAENGAISEKVENLQGTMRWIYVLRGPEHQQDSKSLQLIGGLDKARVSHTFYSHTEYISTLQPEIDTTPSDRIDSPVRPISDLKLLSTGLPFGPGLPWLITLCIEGKTVREQKVQHTLFCIGDFAKQDVPRLPPPQSN
ncbi:hypothetical protein EMPG_17073 [Blastomyces silverae]|uniref:Uncharacterized protein n=1 Tax=Blastomyces silverae TaxID=2060906 RepID=A0A0H1B7T6_9EURO|nr:hypothetical protein EMPG_17073 [Blastomyces silverae]